MQNILYIDEVSKVAGGANSFLQLFASLDRQTYSPYLVCPAGPLADKAKELNVHVSEYVFKFPKYRFDFAGRRPFTPLPVFWRFWDGVRIARLIRQHDIHLIHTNSLNTHYAGWVASKLTGRPIIWHIRIYWPAFFYSFPVIYPDRYIFVSQAVLDAAIDASSERRKLATVIYNGINFQLFKPVPDACWSVRKEFGFALEAKIVGIVGRLNPWKGHRVFLQAAKIIREQRQDTKFFVVGAQVVYDRHDYTGELKQMVHDLGIADSVIFTGHRDDVDRLMSAFDVFVSASTDDPNPRVVLEAMSIGLPIVGTKSGGVPEMVPDQECSLLITPGSTEELAEAVLRLLNDNILRQQIVASSTQRLHNRFNISEHAENVVAVYKQILG